MKKAILFCVIAFQFITFEARGATVVGLHGLLGNSNSMKQVKKSLVENDCRLTVCLWNYPSREKFIAEHACDLVCFLKKIAENCPGEPIHFVTHSVGALVVRAALNRADCPDEAKIGRAVLLAPPNRGSRMGRFFRNFAPVAFLMGSGSGWELLNYSPEQINCFGDFPPTMQVLVLAGTCGGTIGFTMPNDGYVAVDETRLNTPFYYRSFHVTHGELLNSRRVLCCLRNFICCPDPEPESVKDSGSCEIIP